MLKASCLLDKLFFLCGFSPIYGRANIPLHEREGDVDIAHVVEVKTVKLLLCSSILFSALTMRGAMPASDPMYSGPVLIDSSLSIPLSL